MKTQSKFSPYDLWKAKTDLTNKYQEEYKYRGKLIWFSISLLVVSIALNVYLIIT